MAKILLINPPFNFWREDQAALRRYLGTTLSSFGLLLLAASLRQAGHEVQVKDAAAAMEDLSAIIKTITESRPQYLGLTLFTASAHKAAEIARQAKEVLPELRVLVGGPHLTALPAETMEVFPSFDAGVLGEGERTASALLEAWEAGGDLSLLPGVVYRHHGAIQINPPRDSVEDLDVLPYPAWDLLPGFPRRYLPTAYSYRRGPAAVVVSSRGCPFRCTFCDRSLFGNKYRAYSAEYLDQMVAYLEKHYGVRHIFFYDDQFVVSKQRLHAFCEAMLRRQSSLAWNCDVRVDSVNREDLQLMKRGGCWLINFGLESGSPEILASLNKKIDLEQARQTIAWAKEAGIRVKGLFMMGYPNETRQSLRATLDFAKGCGADEINISKFTPYPGSEIYPQAAVTPQDWPRMNSATSFFFPPQDLSLEEMECFYKRALLEFHLHPQRILSYLKISLECLESSKRVFRFAPHRMLKTALVKW